MYDSTYNYMNKGLNKFIMDLVFQCELNRVSYLIRSLPVFPKLPQGVGKYMRNAA